MNHGTPRRRPIGRRALIYLCVHVCVHETREEMHKHLNISCGGWIAIDTDVIVEFLK